MVSWLENSDRLLSEGLSLAAEFPAAGREAWLTLVEKVLAGGDFDQKLVSRTYEGLALQPLYTREDWSPTEDPSGFPGGAPFTRGSSPLGTLRGWDIRQRVGHPDLATTNSHIREELERGATSVLLDTNRCTYGAPVETFGDMERVLEGVHLDVAPVSLSEGGLEGAALLMAVLDRRGVGRKFAGDFGLDAFAMLARTGRLTAPLDLTLARLADTAIHVSRAYPKARAFNVQGPVYHDAGGSASQELGCVLASAVEYLRAMAAAGIDVDTACKQIGFTVAVDGDFFLTIAKLRALRKLWGRVTQVCGSTIRTSHITAQTAARMMTRRDPWVNLLRTTVACFGAGIAGADAITVMPFDAVVGLPSSLGRRLARNTQVILQEESGLARIIDPAGGSYLLEHLTDRLAEKGWDFFQRIERLGGMGAALQSGFVQSQIGTVREERSKNIARRKDPLTGVSEYPDIHEAPLKTEKPPALRPAAPPRGTVARLPEPGSGCFTKALIDGAMNGANVAALSVALEGGVPVSIAPLPRIRLSDDFERLRDAADAFKADHGHFPRIFLANIGATAEFTTRATFAKNFFEAGGIEAIFGAGGKDPVEIAREYAASGARMAVVCGSDKLYIELAGEVARALKAAGAQFVYLAGRGGEQEAEWRRAGIDEFVFAGCDALAVLNAAHHRLLAE
jgi:methylmalonyl-CoA mutase